MISKSFGLAFFFSFFVDVAYGDIELKNSQVIWAIYL